MSDSVKKYHEMIEDGEIKPNIAKYIWLLDFEDGKVYRYDISVLCNDENKWNPDIESCEAFLYGAGHSLQGCEWMITPEKEIINKNFINYKTNTNNIR
tara:strand:+ start:76 stop:369 length:294 start_codon:yes stop_codon:yes gene_type:complete